MPPSTAEPTSRVAPATAKERRDASLSFGDQEAIVYQALLEHLGDSAEDKSGEVDIWIQDLSTDWVVWHCYGGSEVGDFKLAYTLNADQTVQFTGDPLPVVQQSTYVPAPGEAKSADPRRKGRQRRDLARSPEFRILGSQGQHLEVRSAADGSGLSRATGQVIVYGVAYHVNDPWGGFDETIHYGACTELLQRSDLDVRFLFNHGDMPLSRTGSPTCPLVLTETQSGLDIDATFDPRMVSAQDLLYAIENRLITQMSVGMEVDPDGDIWSGEDDYGMPNIRNIVKLANVFDTSAVTYPASPTTSIDLAKRMWDRIPVESRERTRKLWAMARDVRAGRGTSAQADAVMHALERMHQVDDLRSAPTDADSEVADALANAQKWLSDAKAAQAKDPDTNSDPDDKKVNALIDQLLALAGQAMDAQAKDGNPDKPAEAPETKDADDYQGDPDGTATTASGDAPVPDGEDGTGSRAAELQEELRLRRAALEATRRRLAVERARLRAA